MSWKTFDWIVGRVQAFLAALGLITTVLAVLIYILYFTGVNP